MVLRVHVHHIEVLLRTCTVVHAPTRPAFPSTPRCDHNVPIAQGIAVQSPVRHATEIGARSIHGAGTLAPNTAKHGIAGVPISL